MILGISIDENFVYVSVDGEDSVVSYPFSIGRNLSTKTWFIGDEAKNENIDSLDIVVDKLYYIMENDGTAKIGEDVYTSKDLVKVFFSCLLSKYSYIEFLTVVVRKADVKILGKIKKALSLYFKNEDKFKITTYSEAFAEFAKYKGPTYYNNTLALFDFTEKAITYYELSRYKSNDNREFWKVDTKEYLSLPLDLLSGDAGKLVCDNLLLTFSKKCVKDNVYSNIILSGLGFENTSAYREFMTYVCSLAEVTTEVNFFSKAATLISRDVVDNNVDDKVTLITDARTTAAVRLYATINQVEEKIDLVYPGDEWFSIYKKSFDVILDGSKEIKFEILKVIEGVIRDVSVVIPDSFKCRLDKTNLIELNLMFLQQNLLEISVTDKGFGEFFEPTEENTSIPVEI